jgi:hypothetical protein
MPNWKALTIPDATPNPNATPNIFSQNSDRTRLSGRLVFRCEVFNAASPIVNAGKMIWNEMVTAN